MSRKNKEYNYNYAFVFYDVNEKRVQKVFKVCKKYLSHFQYSVFRGEMSPSKFISLRKDIEMVINKEEDFVCIIKLMNDNVFGEEIIGTPNKNTGEDLIIWLKKYYFYQVIFTKSLLCVEISTFLEYDNF